MSNSDTSKIDQAELPPDKLVATRKKRVWGSESKCDARCLEAIRIGNEQGWSREQIAKECKISPYTLRYWYAKRDDVKATIKAANQAKMLRGKPEKVGRLIPLLTPETIDRICDSVAKGLPVEAACEMINVHRATYNYWYGKGKDIREKLGETLTDEILGELPGNDILYARLFISVESARAKALLKWMTLLEEGFDNGKVRQEHRNSQFWLERRAHEFFGSKQAAVQVDVNTNPTSVSDELLARIEKLAQVAQAPKPGRKSLKDTLNEAIASRVTTDGTTRPSGMSLQ